MTGGFSLKMDLRDFQNVPKRHQTPSALSLIVPCLNGLKSKFFLVVEGHLILFGEQKTGSKFGSLSNFAAKIASYLDQLTLQIKITT